MLVAHENGAVNVAIAVINLKLVYLYITIFTSDLIAILAMLYGLPIGTTVYQLVIATSYIQYRFSVLFGRIIKSKY